MDIQGGVIMAMYPKFYVGKGINEYIAQLGDLMYQSEEMCKRSIYPAAGLVADRIDLFIDSIETRAPHGDDGVFEDQRRGLHEGFGISQFQNRFGYIHVKLGFDGYNQHVTDTYPKGQPNAMIARAINSGTSFSKKYPFVDWAVRDTREDAEKMMKENIDGYIYSIMKNEKA